MPSYDYRCKSCDNVVTLERSMTDESTPSCSGCGSDDLNRIWNVVAISGARTPDVGQGTFNSPATRKGGCGSCSGHSCGSCHH